MTTTFIEQEDHWIIRINSIGFRWFKTIDKSNKVLLAKKAKLITQVIEDCERMEDIPDCWSFRPFIDLAM